MIYFIKEHRALTRANCKWLEAPGEAMPIGKEEEKGWRNGPSPDQKGNDHPRRSRACIKAKKWNEKLILVCGQK